MNRFKPVAAMVSFALTGILTLSPAAAGVKSARPVTINVSGMVASGAPGNARNSTDTHQSIGCLSSADAGVGSEGMCSAVDATGLSRQCFTFDAELLATIRSLNGDSFLTFSWNSDGSCSEIIVSNRSEWQPKAQ